MWWDTQQTRSGVIWHFISILFIKSKQSRQRALKDCFCVGQCRLSAFALFPCPVCDLIVRQKIIWSGDQSLKCSLISPHSKQNNSGQRIHSYPMVMGWGKNYKTQTHSGTEIYILKENNNYQWLKNKHSCMFVYINSQLVVICIQMLAVIPDSAPCRGIKMLILIIHSHMWVNYFTFMWFLFS